MMDVLKRWKIPLNNCVALGVDNTNSNVGQHNSLKSRITTDNPSVFVAGCVCHILHNAAVRAVPVYQVIDR